MPVLIPILQRLQLLESLPVQQLAPLSTTLAERVVDRRGVVIKRGEPNAGLGFLIEGRLQVLDFTVDGREVGLHFIEPGDFFGELSVIDRQPASEYVIAVAPSRTVFIDSERARELMFSTPRAAEAVSLRMAQRMREVARLRAVLSLPSSFQRVCAQLRALVQSDGKGRTVILLPPTHQEIAIMVNTSRETVTRALQFLQASRVVLRVGNELVIERPETLQQAAEGKIVPGKE